MSLFCCEHKTPEGNFSLTFLGAFTVIVFGGWESLSEGPKSDENHSDLKNRFLALPARSPRDWKHKLNLFLLVLRDFSLSDPGSVGKEGSFNEDDDG